MQLPFVLQQHGYATSDCDSRALVPDNQIGAHGKHQEHSDFGCQTRVNITLLEPGEVADDNHSGKDNHSNGNDRAAERLRKQAADCPEDRNQWESAYSCQTCGYTFPLQADQESQA
jgi:hypothetical protein